MADKYIDGELTTGTQSGDDWANAYHTEANIQAAYDQLTAGDTLHATRTQTLTAPIDIDQASGSSGSPITVLGYNYNSGSPIVDGTKYVIDANSAAANCILVADKDYWHFKNVEFENATADNVTAKTDHPRYWWFVNCESHAAGTRGWGDSGGKTFRNSFFVLCQSYLNGTAGFSLNTVNSLLFCTAHSNGQSSAHRGFQTDHSTLIGCVAYNQTGQAFCDTGNGLMFGCVSDDPSVCSVLVSAGKCACIVASRLTGTGVGVQGGGTGDLLDLYNFINTSTKTDSITVDQQIRGSNTRIESGVEGYIDAAGGNFGLINSAAARRQEVTL